MNPVFAGSLEKRKEGERPVAAHVLITERQGVWSVTWTEPDAEGKPASAVWFEGGCLREMLDAFRTKLAEKTAEGFLPLIGAESGRGG